MEMTKREGGALVRIGDLHTGRRFRQYNRQPVLPTRGHYSFIPLFGSFMLIFSVQREYCNDPQ